MANTFRRLPIAGGDNNTWAPYLLAIISDSIGCYSSYLYDDSGTLKLSKGKIGIDNDTNEGICLIDTVTTITLDATNGIWQKIEVSVSGSAVTLSATAIAGKTDPSIVPTEFTGVYDPEKSGYYISTTKRCIGVIFKNSAGVLDGIVNAENNILGYYGKGYLNTTHTAQMFWEKKQSTWRNYAEYQIGIWDMDNNVTKAINHYLANWLKVKSMDVIIFSDNGLAVLSLLSHDNSGLPYIHGCNGSITSTAINLNRATGGMFDAAAYSNLPNRGYGILELME